MSRAPQDIILQPLISEKSTRLLKENKYVFKVSPTSNKVEIRKAVEEAFGVRVDNVRTMHVRGKNRRWRGRITGKTPSWKKAIVKLKQGESIDELGV
ncbi:50S ribosomal protein L23 [Candidatus Aerophobetes bacterium]|nr:50S ribosomal protein L23 [Candidatus Aerophobetes bacterium]